MSKKRTKSPANNIPNNTKWESNIVNTDLKEVGWSYSLSFLVEDIIEDKETIEYIRKGIQTGLRRKFSLLSWESITEIIGEYGNPKSKKTKEVPANFEVCECAKAYLDRGEKIPSSVIAKVIKWMMLSAKSNDVKSKDDSIKKADTKGSKPKKGSDKPDVSKSSAGKKGSQGIGKRSPEPPSVKGDTKLRKRGDPDPDVKYIDDEPDDGSSRYFVVTGISDPDIIESLAEIGCIVTSVIKITRDIHISSKYDEENEETMENSSIHSNQSKDLEKEKDKQTDILKTFWNNISKILNSNKALFNTPIVTLVAKHLMFPINKDDVEQQEKCSMDLYESVAVSMYDLLDLKRQWKNYLDKSKIIELPFKISEEVKSEIGVNESARDDKVPSEDGQVKVESRTSVTFESVELDYYKYLLEEVPLEETSIYLQMSAMLDQVEVTMGDKSVDWNKPKLSNESELSEEAAEMLNELIDNLYIPKEELKELRKNLQINSVTNNDKRHNGKEVPIHELDGISLRDNEIISNSLGKEGSMIRELRMLIKSFQHMDLLDVISLEESVRAKRLARLQEFLKYIDNIGLSKIEIDYAIKLFISENLVLSGTDENGIMRVNDEDGVFPKNINQMWDDPFMIMDDVGQSIIEEEHKIKETKVETFEDISETTREDSSLSEKGSSRSMEGILKNSRSPRLSSERNKSDRRKSSVHFVELEKNEFSGCVTEAELDVTGMLENEQDEPLQSILLDYLYNVRKRSFTEWCFEEFYEPHVILQIIQQAFYKLPFLDMYNQRHTDGKIVILHNPFQENVRYNHQPWNQWLHANVGFRNYLDFINDKIKDWTRDEEAIYQALLLNKELESNEKSKEEETPKEIPKKGADKPKKGKVSQSRSRSDSRSSSAESTNKEILFVLPGSLKALKMEQDKILKVKEDEEKKKEEKRALSSQKKLDKDQLKDKPKRPSSKTSNKSKSKRSVIEDTQDQMQLTLDDPIIVEAEEYWPFVGYDLGDDLAHFSGEVAHLFPSDGCTIRVHRTQKLLDSTSVRVSIITAQAHVFSLHIVDPSFDTEEEIDNFQKVLDTFNNKSNISRYGSSTCVFNDGISLAASNYGYSGTSDNNNTTKEKEQLVDCVENTSHRSDRNSGEIKANVLQDATLVESSRTPNSSRNKNRDNVDIKDVQNIILTTPNGVQIRIGYEINEYDQRQSLLLSLTKNEPQSLKDSKTSKFEVVRELGRYVTSDGRVISILNNDSIKVMFADGTIATASLQMETTVTQEVDSEETKVEKTTARETPIQKKKKQSKMPATDQIINAEVNVEESKSIINKTRIWTITRPNGEVYESKANLNVVDPQNPLSKSPNKETGEESTNTSEERDLNKSSEIPFWKRYIQTPNQKESLFISCATDPATGETLVTRSDGTLLLTTQDAGIFLSEHSDQTRFTKYFIIEQKSPQSKYKEEEAETTKVTEIIQIESKDYPMITIDRTNGKIETRCGSMGSLISGTDGSHFYKHSDGTEIEYRSDGEMIFTAAGNSQMSYLQPYGSSSYVLNTTSNIICEMLDSDGTEFIVDASGSYEVKMSQKVEPSTEIKNEGPLKPTSAISGTSIIEDNNDESLIRKFNQHAPRVFFLNPDGSGSELLRYRDIVDTIVNAEVDDNYFQYKESVQDHPHIIGHTIMNFVKKTKPWKYNYARKTIIPKGLTCRDLKTFPTKEEVKKGPAFAMNIGRGLSIKSNPIESELTKAIYSKESKDQDCLQFRQFYHYPLITDEVRNSFTQKLIEYNKKILRERQKYKDLEVLDDRSHEEQMVAQKIRIKYNDIKKINGQILDNAMQAMSGAVLSPKLDNSCESNPMKISKSSGKKLEILLEKEKIEKEKELENKNALRNQFVPKYFTSIYGKDFLTRQAVDLKTLNKTMQLFPVSREPTTRLENSNTKEVEEMESSVYSSNVELEKCPNTSAMLQVTNVEENHSINTDKQTIVFKKKEKKYLYYDSSLIIPNIPKRVPISTNLPLPRYLYSERPSIEQNIKQATVEDPVRRKQFTTSLIGGPPIGQVFQRQCRGLNVLPARLDTGLLKEGGRYTFKIKIINTGPESGFFKIKQPPSSTGIWVEFLPGPIAAGLSREITVHVYAIAKSLEQSHSRIYVIDEPLRIITNTDILEIPITGTVMTAANYDLIYPSKKIEKIVYTTSVESFPAIRSESCNMVTIDPSQE